MTSTVKTELLSLSDFAYQRLAARLAGLTDEEYLWEPAPLSWNVRPHPDGTCDGDWGVLGPYDAPMTTIAWRVSHIVDCIAAERIGPCLGVDDPELVVRPGESVRPTAAGAIELLDQANRSWRSCITASPDDELDQPMGPVAAFFADSNRIAFILHIVDELIHHGAEVALLRDLHRARTLDPFVVRALGAPDQLGPADAAALAAHPDIAVHAAAVGRWAAVRALVELGAPLQTADGLSALHLAAGADDVPTVRYLVDHGADLEALDPTYRSTPLGWAEFLGREAAAEELRRARL